MIFCYAEPKDVIHVAENMRERDYEEISCLTFAEGRKELAQYLANLYSQHQNVYAVGTAKEGPIAILAYIPVRPGVWSLGMFATDSFQKIGRFLTKTIIRDIIPSLDRANAHRVEAQSIEGYKEIHRWLQFLGLQKEGEMPGYGRNGENFITFSYVRADGQAPGTVKWRKSGVVG